MCVCFWTWLASPANIWIYLLGDKLLVDLCHWRTFSGNEAFLIWRSRFICSVIQKYRMEIHPWLAVMGYVLSNSCVYILLSTTSARSPKIWKPVCIICSEQAKSARKSFVPSVRQREARGIRGTPSVLCCRSVQIPPPQPGHCVLQANAAKSRRGWKGMFGRFLDLMSGAEKEYLLVPAEESVSRFRGCWERSCCFLHTHWHLILLSSMERTALAL